MHTERVLFATSLTACAAGYAAKEWDVLSEFYTAKAFLILSALCAAAYVALAGARHAHQFIADQEGARALQEVRHYGETH